MPEHSFGDPGKAVAHGAQAADDRAAPLSRLEIIALNFPGEGAIALADSGRKVAELWSSGESTIDPNNTSAGALVEKRFHKGNVVNPKSSPRFLVPTANGVGLTAVAAALTAAATNMGYRITVVPPPLTENAERMITPLLPAPNVDPYYAALAASSLAITSNKPMREIIKAFRKANRHIWAEDVLQLTRVLPRISDAVGCKLKDSDFLVFEIGRGKCSDPNGPFIKRHEFTLFLMDLW